MNEHTHETQGIEEGNAHGAGSQMDDINIPVVAVSVAFFACLLVVTITGLQAWFMHADSAEIAAKTARQEDPRTTDVLRDREKVSTPLGKILQLQRGQLYLPPNQQIPEPVVASAPTSTTSAPQPKLWVSIDTAMDLVSKDYAKGTNR